ncbi:MULTISPECIES: DUF2171 domain-containing protein [unclassified Deinococcus]|uniref:DUF2171 domain-containing protein n=1 Tax=unclassified Deinococcus TaxID=2623546 RepID=UPI0010550664|nr:MULTISPECIES: DUF2171 domain-containing protein [unclassified Deinococcus]MBI0446210.1 DUF2171 domain-containing protein [Deinococcus sp. DB0503]TDE87152.1 DUF2171 domain-containing protein [Deinococcus sp. S9]
MTQNQNSDQNVASQIDNRIEQDLRERLQRQGEHMQVKDKNGDYVGTVDHIEGDQLKLTKSGSHDGQHHYVPLSSVESMDDVAVYLNVTQDQIK